MSLLPVAKKNAVKIAVIFICLITLLFVGIAIFAFLNVTALASIQIEKIQKQTGLTLNNSSTDYNPWKGGLVLHDVQLETEYGVSIKAERVSFTVPLLSLWQDEIPLSHILLNNSDVRLSLKQFRQWDHPIALQKIVGTEKLDFKSGTLSFIDSGAKETSSGLPRHLAFDQLSVDAVDSKTVRIFAAGHLSDGDWSYNGRLKMMSPVLKGELELDDIPISLLKEKWGQKNADIELDGNISGSFLTRWDLDQGFDISGNTKISSGYISSPAVSLNWKTANIEQLQYSSESLGWSACELALWQAQIAYQADRISKVSTSFTLPINIKEISAKNATINASGNSLLPERVLSVDLSIEPGVKALGYKLAGSLPLEKGSITAEGHISYSGAEIVHEFVIDINQLVAGKGNIARRVGAYDINGALINVHVSGREHDGLLSADAEFMVKMRGGNKIPIANTDNYRLVLALMMDSTGLINTPVGVRNKKRKIPLKKMLFEALEARWDAIGSSPYQYLSSLDGITSPVSSGVAFKPGKFMSNTETINRFQGWALALKQRPALHVTIEGRASKQDDWPLFSSVELEKSLVELYSAIKKKPAGEQGADVQSVVSIPDSVRSHLIEQMYLRTQNQKLPEIGGASEEKRVQVAEQWLLRHWPYDGESLKTLADDRSSYIKDALVHAGVEPERIRLLPSVVEEEEGLISEISIESYLEK